MTEAHTQSISLLILHGMMRNDFRTIVVRFALDHRKDKDISPSLKSRLEQAIRRSRVKVNGYRDGEVCHAPSTILEPSVLVKSQKSSELFAALLNIWVEGHPELLSAVATFYNERQRPVVPPILIKPLLTDDEVIDDIQQLRAAFEAEHPGFDTDEAALMLFCLGGSVEKEEEPMTMDTPFTESDSGASQPEAPCPLSGTRWADLLEEMRCIPAVAQEWFTFDIFIAQAHSLSDIKSQERKGVSATLQTSLDELRNCCTEQLRLFEYNDVSSWQAESCPVAECHIATASVKEFHRLLQRYRDIEEQIAKAVIIREKKLLRSQLDDIENNLDELHETLGKQLVRGSNPPQPSPDDQGGEPLADTETTTDTENPPTVPQGQRLAGQYLPHSQKVGTLADVNEVTAPPSESPLGIDLYATDISEQPLDAQDTSIQESSLQNTIIEVGDSIGFSDVSDGIDGVITPDLSDEVNGIATTTTSNHTATEATLDHATLCDIPEEAGIIVNAIANLRDERDISLPLADDAGKVPSVLRTSMEIASVITADEPSDLWYDFCWTLIAEGDIASAYLVAVACEGLNYRSPVQPWLLAALQGSLWLSPRSDLFIDDLRTIASDHPDIQQLSPEESTLAISTALHATLLAPTSELHAWLRCPPGIPAIAETVNAIAEFVHNGIALHSEELYEFDGSDQRDDAIQAVAHQAKEWLNTALSHRTTLLRASDVWRNLIGAKGELHALLLPVSNDQRDSVARVREMLMKWSDRKALPILIRNLDRQLAGRKSREIVGAARDMLLSNIQQTVTLAKQWCELVERDTISENQGNWISQRVSILRQTLKTTLPECEAFLTTMIGTPSDVAQHAASLCLGRTCHLIRNLLNLSSTDFPLPMWHLPSSSWQVEGVESLEHALQRQLLILPEVTVYTGEHLQPSSCAELLSSIREAYATGRTLEMAFDKWIEKQDLRFIERIIAAMADQQNADLYLRRYREELEGNRLTLRDEVSQTLVAIERAVVDGIITEEERSKYCGQVERIDVEETRNFFEQRRQLQSVLSDLEKSRDSRLFAQRTIWQELLPRVEQHMQNLPDLQRKTIVDFVQHSLDHGDTRVVDECLSRLRTALDEHAAINETWFGRTEERDILREFLHAVPQIQTWLEREQGSGLRACTKLIERGGSIAGIHFGSIASVRRQEIIDAIESWRLLKQRNERSPDVSLHLEKLLRFLGFQLKFAQGKPLQVISQRPEWLHARIAMSASDLARPIPQFGTLANNSYDIMCLWERPGPDTIGASLHEQRIANRNLIVFYLGRLTDRQRHELLRVTRDRDLAIALFDETLLLFLAGESDPSKRLPAFLQCTLPYATINPYTIAGEVPEEMFFGRDEMVADLINPSGSCIVYGGRQLGKSSLLRHIERVFHNTQNEQYAFVSDIRNLLNHAINQGTETIWRQLWEALSEMGLITSPASSSESTVTKQIRKIMTDPNVPHRRVIIMFDEADAFLHADSQDDFQVVVALREIMKSTQNRFKVIFAGLNSVQRFQAIPNHPLAQFKAPIRVGPLDPTTAKDLVRIPLEYLGYRLDGPDGEAALLRILSYTNYHPGLIQMICEELILKLRKRRDLPPYQVTKHDVESLYSPEVRARIRDRFELTLNLDDHYKAVTWAMIQDQIAIRDSFAREYPPQAIFELVNHWWPEGFTGLDLGTFEGILDEMCGLGVLVPADGTYRLRSPNLVRLMGTIEYIETRLLELETYTPVAKDDPESFHSLLEQGRGHARSNVLTYAQERALNPRQFGVGMIIGSEALGLSVLPEAIHHFAPNGLPEIAICEAIRPEENNIGEWLRKYFVKHGKHEQIIVFQVLDDPPVNFAHHVTEAIRFCKERKQSQRQWMRVHFLLSPRAAWAWLTQSSTIREKVERDIDFRQTHLKRWTYNGILHGLRQHDLMDSEEICKSVLEVTGGWPWLLQWMLERCKDGDDPRQVLRGIADDMSQPSSTLRELFRETLGLNPDKTPVAWEMLRFLHLMGKTRSDELTSDILETTMELPPDLFRNAFEYLKMMGVLTMSYEEHYELMAVEPIAARALFES